jgi:ribosomal protein L29
MEAATWIEIGLAIGLPSVGGLIWLIRLEGKVKTNEEINNLKAENLEHQLKAADKELSDLRTKHEGLANQIVEKLSNVEKSLAKIEGRLSVNQGNGHN